MAVDTSRLKSAAAAPPQEFQASERYRYYVVWFLFVVYVFNFVDRQILTTLMEPIKKEFGLHDWQLGALGGTAFALFYTTFGIPIARWADKGNRVNIIALALLIWSSATAVTAFARNFWQLFAARVVVGIGESGCSPPALSLISDYFEPKRRGKALSIYAMGVYGGTFIGLMMGGVVAGMYGWRAAFFIVGVPGIVLALILKLTVREPPRGFSEGGAHTVVCLFLYVCFGTMYLAPSISATYRLVAPRERALATAVLFLVLNFIGIGIGPLLTGFISHTIGNNLVESGLPADQASADGLRYALCIIVFTFVWSTFHYYRAMRTLREEELVT